MTIASIVALLRRLHVVLALVVLAAVAVVALVFE